MYMDSSRTIPLTQLRANAKARRDKAHARARGISL